MPGLAPKNIVYRILNLNAQKNCKTNIEMGISEATFRAERNIFERMEKSDGISINSKSVHRDVARHQCDVAVARLQCDQELIL